MVALTAPAADTLEKRVEAIQAELQTSIDRAGLRDDVLRHPLLALSATIGLFPGLVAEMQQAVETARQLVDPAAIARIEAAAASGASKRVGQLARAHGWRTVLLIGVVFAAGAAAAGGSGYFAGRSSTVATASAAAAAAVRDGPEAAQFWLQVMQANDGRSALQSCKSTTVRSDGNRLACALPIWTEPAPISGPRTQATK